MTGTFYVGSKAVEYVLENGLLRPEELVEYIRWKAETDLTFLLTIERLLGKLDWQQMKVKVIMSRLERGKRR